MCSLDKHHIGIVEEDAYTVSLICLNIQIRGLGCFTMPLKCNHRISKCCLSLRSWCFCGWNIDKVIHRALATIKNQILQMIDYI